MSAATACERCACADAIPKQPKAAAPEDLCLCDHPIGAHVGECPKCQAEIRGLDVACRRCGALVGDEIERQALEPKSGLAIASFAVGLLLPIGAPLAIIFGVITLRQIKRHPNTRGRGLAIAGVSLGCFWLVLLAVSLALEGL